MRAGIHIDRYRNICWQEFTFIWAVFSYALLLCLSLSLAPFLPPSFSLENYAKRVCFGSAHTRSLSILLSFSPRSIFKLFLFSVFPRLQNNNHLWHSPPHSVEYHLMLHTIWPIICWVTHRLIVFLFGPS